MKTDERETQALTYADAGVDLRAKDAAYVRIKELVRSTYRPEVLGGLGSFGGLFALGEYADPVLVSSVDGVGTKLKIAFGAGRHDTVGYDIVAHCANDVVVQGAAPLFFLDYIGIGDLDPDVVTEIVKGLASGCREVGCALIGGETAELPEFYAKGEYDLAGTVVGVVEREALITGERIGPGDVLLGLPSSGLHTNGYTLARKVLFEVAGLSLDSDLPGCEVSVADALLEPHRSYVHACLGLAQTGTPHGFAHITGGGLPSNVPRILPAGCRARIERDAWDVPDLFRVLQELGRIEDEEMYRVFNMGIGMVAAVARDDVTIAIEKLTENGDAPFVIGEIEHGAPGVDLV
jgi:phosphoribosylformylglycinamidine cyclo-ligase